MDWEHLKIGEIFVKLGMVTDAQLEAALEIQKSSGKRLGKVLIEQGLLNEEEFATAIALQKNLPLVNFSDYRINVQAVNAISEGLARKYSVFPIDFDDSRLVLAMANPLDIQAIDDVSLTTGLDIKVVVAIESQILQAINKYLTDEGYIKEAVDLAETSATARSEQEETAFEDTPIVRLANQIIQQGVEQGASDIHIEPQADRVSVRNRIDGVLQNSMTIPRKVQLSLVSRFKIMSTLDIAEHRLPQDGRHSLKVGSENIDLRVATIPTAFGENVSIRIHHKSSSIIGLDELGLQPEALQKYKLAYTKPYGTVLAVGPTGCGKSTTLYATLRIINSPTKKIFTVEDPVEYLLPGLLQVQVNLKTGLTFAAALRSIIRCDPDIMMIGEIRDLETAKIAVKSALTGHLVFSTLHTNDAPSAVTRLTEMGIEPFLVSSSIDCVVAQRLARKLCTNCKESYEASGSVLEKLGLAADTKGVTIYKAKGCDRCYGTGYHGRIGLFEVMTTSDTIAALCLERRSSDEIRKVAIQEGMEAMIQDGFRKVKQGITSIEEVMRVVI